MSKKKRAVFIVVWVALMVIVLVAALLVGGSGESESIKVVMRDAVLHGTNKVSLELFVSIANALNVSADALLIDSIENTERISGSFFAAAAFDCNEFERRVLLELLIASKEAIRKNKRFLRYEDVK